MKNRIILTFAMLLIAALLIGTGTVQAEQNKVIQVSTVDEFIAAIAPGAEIHLAEGIFNLAEASTYGSRTGNPYVKWEESWEGYGLLIHDVDGLTIIGAEKEKTEIVAECPNVNVLSFEDSAGITLQSFTAGHTEQAEGCQAGVIRFYRSENAYLSKLGLYGCGSIGISAEKTVNMTVTDTEIYDCSSTGVDLSACENVTIENTSVHNIGKYVNDNHYGYALFSVYYSSNITVRSCEMENNTTSYLVVSVESHDISITQSRFADNAAPTAMFSFYDTDVVIDSTDVFENNTFSHWYEKSWDGSNICRAVNELGEVMFPEDPAPVHSSGSEAIEPRPVITVEQKQVMVSTVDEFLAAIDSNTEIVLAEGTYNLSEAADYGSEAGAEHYTWENQYDGYGLVISNVENLTIISDDGIRSTHLLVSVPRYADVVTFRSCSNVLVKGVTVGHTTEPSQCAGGVLFFEDCSQILVDNCNLYGCGILGVTAWYVTDIQIANSSIYECSYGGINCVYSQEIVVGGCRFWDLGGDTFQLSGCADVTIDGREISGDYYGD